ncbi:hypothetical protein AX15_007193, partial [Amanita polypyramis BW_CC]
FTNPSKAIGVPNVVAPIDAPQRDDEYYVALEDAFTGPSQSEIDEQQDFVNNVYRIIERKIEDEPDVFLIAEAYINDEKWSPLAPDANIPTADIIS